MEIFDIVRIVSVKDKMEYVIDENGQLKSSGHACFAVWEKNGKCTNCISAKAISCRGKTSKFEIRGNDVYQVIAKMVEIDGQEYAVEFVMKEDSVLIDAIGKETFISSIVEENKKLYKDTLTKVYNRLYYNEQIKNQKVCAIAEIDIDDFKTINDTYGHGKGDEVLKNVASILSQQVRTTDSIIRMGGDEFLIAFHTMPKNSFSSRLSQIAACVQESEHVSISVGGLITDICDDQSMDKVDELLYQAKSKKNMVICE